MHYTTSSNTQSSAPEDGQNNCPKHVELIRIINKPLLLHLVGCLYYLYERKFMILFMDVNKMAVHQLGQRILLTVQYFSVQCAPTSKRSLLCIKFLHPAAACPSGKRSIKMNVITAHWWKDKWQGRHNHSQKILSHWYYTYHKPNMDLLNSIRVSAVSSRSNKHSLSDQD